MKRVTVLRGGTALLASGALPALAACSSSGSGGGSGQKVTLTLDTFTDSAAG